jgi:hypothetical protein
MVKKLAILAVAGAFVWYFFIRKKALPTMVVVNQPSSPTNAANNAATRTINTVATAAQPGIAAITGYLVNGVAISLAQYGQGGSNGADTNAGSGDFYGTLDGTGGYF